VRRAHGRLHAPARGRLTRNPAHWARRTIFKFLAGAARRRLGGGFPRHPPALPTHVQCIQRLTAAHVAIEWHGHHSPSAAGLIVLSRTESNPEVGSASAVRRPRCNVVAPKLHVDPITLTLCPAVLHTRRGLSSAAGRASIRRLVGFDSGPYSFLTPPFARASIDKLALPSVVPATCRHP